MTTADSAPPDAATSAPRTARDRARAELTAEILATARRHLADVGASSLSLRAVSRDLGMASSALYRYFPSRDALLTRLIIEAYDALGEACEAAEAGCARDDLLGRWRSITHEVRAWALAHPHEYALVYGSPIPGYAAPTDTIDPAGRVARLLIQLLFDIEASGAADPALTAPIPASLSAQIHVLADGPVPVDHQRALFGVGAWVQLFGMISFELFGQFVNTFDDAEALFAHQVDLMAVAVGLRP